MLVWDSATGRVVATFRPTPAPTAFTHGRVALDGDGIVVAFDDYEDAAFDAVARAPLGHPRSFIRVCEVAGGRELLRLPMPDAGVVFSRSPSAPTAAARRRDADGTRLDLGREDRRGPARDPLG